MALEADCTDPSSWQGQGIACTPELCIPSNVDDGPLATTLAVRAVPTPFAGRTTLVFTGPQGAEGSLLIVDASGRKVRSVWQGVLHKRAMTFEWDGRDDSGREAPSGIYLARLRSGAGSAVARLVKTR